MHGEGGHAWQRGACMVKGRRVWWGACMAGLECILLNAASTLTLRISLGLQPILE